MHYPQTSSPTRGKKLLNQLPIMTFIERIQGSACSACRLAVARLARRNSECRSRVHQEALLATRCKAFDQLSPNAA
jgi:hypothetical protein